MADEIKNNEESDIQDSPTKVPAKIRRWILGIVGVIGAFTILLNTSDEFLNAAKSFWCTWLHDCTVETEYTEFLLDASSDMANLFLTENETAKNKWVSLQESFAKVLPAFSESPYAVRYFGQDECASEKSTGRLAKFDHELSESDIKKKIDDLVPKGDASLVRALNLAVSDFEGHIGPDFKNNIVVISSGNICDDDPLSLNKLKERMTKNGFVLDFKFVALAPDGNKLRKIIALAQNLGGTVYPVDEPDQIYAALTDKEPADIYKKATNLFDTSAEELAMLYFEYLGDGNDDALVYRARILLNINGKYRNDEKGVELLKDAVKLNNKEAMYRLGKLLAKGREPAIKQDIDRARELLTRADALGHPEAEQELLSLK